MWQWHTNEEQQAVHAQGNIGLGLIRGYKLAAYTPGRPGTTEILLSDPE
jgi:hypothetical protein